MLLDLVTVAVIGFVGFRLVSAFRRATKRDATSLSLQIVRGLRPRHFLPIPLVLVLVLVTAALLVQVPGLDFGWWSAIGGEGNAAFGSTERTRGTPLELLIPLVFVLLLLPALPLFARREEEIFRLGAEDWSMAKRVLKAIVFGLVHVIVGIPIGVALALSIGGAWFTLAYMHGYRRGGRAEALMESTRSHTAYNGTIVVLLLLALAYEVAVELTA
ncbi:MAG TPA: hypothetical protein VF230_00545 [Acidimicrobiales bacterium]